MGAGFGYEDAARESRQHGACSITCDALWDFGLCEENTRTGTCAYDKVRANGRKERESEKRACIERGC